MPPRRSHKKSRAGCKRCKARKIKCDEVHPRCGNCSKHGVPCDFEHPNIKDTYTPASNKSDSEIQRPPSSASASAPPSVAHDGSPSNTTEHTTPTMAATPSANVPMYKNPDLNPLPSRSNKNRMLELRLLHHYITVTSETLAISSPVSTISEKIWRETVPHLAFSGAGYVADALLAVAALHMRSINPRDREVVQAGHSYMASTLSEYGASLREGITEINAESLFLTAALIAFQSTASRIFAREDVSEPNNVYSLPMAWFHSFQGVKAVVAASWMWLRNSSIVIPIIESQPALNLDLSGDLTFFSDLMVGVEEEVQKFEADNLTTQMSTRMAYQHAIAVLDWAHKIPHTGAPLVFLATVSRRFVELLETRRPRALAILASYFALLKCLDNVWWLKGVARREIMGIVSLFNPDDEEWWPRLQWPLRIALHDDPIIPPQVWGADFLADARVLEQTNQNGGFVSHIELVSEMFSSMPQADPEDLEPAHEYVLEQQNNMRDQMLIPEELEILPVD
ncbi:hypothetical protein F5Y18DRAFT_423458 [Xylariaceae sp. FL1019]|nr:hypothetical protein F5Y18DRAFT_423458 [Xylariaceae sp. FL1019]